MEYWIYRGGPDWLRIHEGTCGFVNIGNKNEDRDPAYWSDAYPTLKSAIHAAKIDGRPNARLCEHCLGGAIVPGGE